MHSAIKSIHTFVRVCVFVCFYLHKTLPVCANDMLAFVLSFEPVKLHFIAVAGTGQEECPNPGQYVDCWFYCFLSKEFYDQFAQHIVTFAQRVCVCVYSLLSNDHLGRILQCC